MTQPDRLPGASPLSPGQLAGGLLACALVAGACGGSSARSTHPGEGGRAEAASDARGRATGHPGETTRGSGTGDLDPEVRRAAASTPVPENPQRVAITGGDGPARGATEPLVEIVQFSDFECPFCARVVPTLERLLDRYPNQVRLVFRHLPLPMHAHAEQAALAAEEIRRQLGDAGFWRFHDQVFAHQEELGRDGLRRLAASVDGVDLLELERALSQERHAERIQADETAAHRVGARGTPTQFINGRKVLGAQPFEQFDEVVRQELALAARFLEMGMPRSEVRNGIMADASAEAVPERPAPARPPPGSPDPDAIYAVPVPDDVPRRGGEAPLVTVVEFGDFECPFCARVLGTLDELEERYRDDLRIVWMNNPLPFHTAAKPAAIAAHEVYRQAGDEAFWAYHDQLFAHQRDGLSREDLVRWAAEIEGVDVGELRRALDASRHEDVLQAQQQLAVSRGARGTPNFFINGRYVGGAQPVEAFARVIDEELARARALVDAGTPRAQRVLRNPS